MIAVTLYDLFNNAERGEGFLLLADSFQQRGLLIFLGPGATQIVRELFSRRPLPSMVTKSRPQTFAFLASMLQAVSAEVVEVQVTELTEKTFRACAIVRANGTEHRIEARPSDAVTLATWMGRPIVVADDLMAREGIDLRIDERPAEIPEGFVSTREFWAVDP